MTKPLLLAAFVATSVLCTFAHARSFRFEILANLQTPIPSFTFDKPVEAPPRGQRSTVSLNRFVIVEKRAQQGRNYPRLVWAFGLRPGIFREVREIQYGTVPAGFSEDASPKALTPGATYLALAFGAGSSGSEEFTVTHFDPGGLPRRQGRSFPGVLSLLCSAEAGSNTNVSGIGSAAGGFLLYPNKADTNMTRSLYLE